MNERELIPPCGLYCGVCSILMAHRDNNQKFKEILGNFYGVAPEEIRCQGCMSDEVYGFCQVCAIKTCAGERGYESCHQCTEFPCDHISNFFMPVGKKVMLRAIPRWREVGTEQWVEEEKQRYVCPHCGGSLFRGAKRCRACKEPVDVD